MHNIQTAWTTGIVMLFACAFNSDLRAAPPTFEKSIVPIFKSRCFKCHGEKKREGELDLRRKFTIQKGGDSGSAIDVKHPAKSLLLELITEGLMPPEGEPPLSKTQIEVIKQWINAGAPLSGKTEAPLVVQAEETTAKASDHWAFQPIKRPSVPKVSHVGELQNSVDGFILAELEQRSWQPAELATRGEWIRRVTFDLTGLPPDPEDITAFESDDSIEAYEKVVDRLLASPHYGERWGQHWLDVVRYSETEGFEYDRHLPDAWRYRDYVIDSFNRDKPFDQFVTEQIAGDEIGPNDPEYLSASILHRLGAVRRNAGNPDIALSRNEVLTERTNIIGEAFLGLSVGCARCHNHKLEPITQKDYYRLQAYFAASAEFNKSLAAQKDQAAWEKQTQKIQKQIAALKKQAANAKGAKKEQLTLQMQALEDELPPHPPTIPTVHNDFPNRTAIHVLRRGEWEQKGVPVGPRPLSSLVSASRKELKPNVINPRTQLAKWLTNPSHPLTARVMVNRVWQHHFGTGLVRSANDFGTKGDRPSHPELLDWLTVQLLEHNWRLKPLHRMIVLSRTYRQSSQSRESEEMESLDPDNRMLWRFPRRRLSAEEIRDAMLVTSGRFSSKLQGPSVMVPVDQELINLLYKPSQWQVTSEKTEHDRRSVYLIAKRNLRLPFFEAFDAPALQTSCSRRESSTHAPQALELLNGRLANDMADAFGERLTRECGNHQAAIVERGFWLALGRGPSDLERELSLEFLRDQPLNEFALTLFNLNGFVYVR